MSKPRIRCAIYTRKSHEDGLEQEFNSLDAQREACAAYITSQKSEGWLALPTHYDDGGYSGGTLERPALQRLLSDIDAGRVDVVVVYKVDRLTRSLGDFARIVERLDARGASFVSVTQSFNTTSSMGRLTLNVLLSFAQFEREVTGERIRDKIAASKAKGLWMGGQPPLGYEAPEEGKSRILRVNPQEAERVRHIFKRYLEIGSVHLLTHELREQGIGSKARVAPDGTSKPSMAFTRGALFYLLKNPVYIGRIRHKTETHQGLHEAIISEELFAEVQAKLETHTRRKPQEHRGDHSAPLKGLLYDADGSIMSPTTAYGKQKRAYRYYVSAPLQTGMAQHSDALRRIPAAQIETLVAGSLQKLTGQSPDSGWDRLHALLARVELRAKSVELIVHNHDEQQLGEWAARAAGWGQIVSEERNRIRCIIATRTMIRGGRSWVVTPDGLHPRTSRKPNAKLIAALKDAHEWLRDLKASPLTPMIELQNAKSPPDSYVRRLTQLAFLAPDIQQAILEGRQPVGLTVKALLASDMPLDWQSQRQRFGFVA